MTFDEYEQLDFNKIKIKLLKVFCNLVSKDIDFYINFNLLGKNRYSSFDSFELDEDLKFHDLEYYLPLSFTELKISYGGINLFLGTEDELNDDTAEELISKMLLKYGLNRNNECCYVINVMSIDEFVELDINQITEIFSKAFYKFDYIWNMYFSIK